MRLLLFLTSGAASTVLDISLFAYFLRFFDGGFSYVASYALCVVLRYAFDARLTFREKKYNFRHFVVYFIANLCLMLLGFVIFHLLTMEMSDVYAKVISIPPVTLLGFFVMNKLVFNKPRQQGGGVL